MGLQEVKKLAQGHRERAEGLMGYGNIRGPLIIRTRVTGVTSLTAPCCFSQRHQHQGPLETSGLNHAALLEGLAGVRSAGRHLSEHYPFPHWGASRPQPMKLRGFLWFSWPL